MHCRKSAKLVKQLLSCPWVATPKANRGGWKTRSRGHKYRGKRGPTFKHSEAFSFQIATDNQEETDRYWNAIVGNGGQESQCGWWKDKWGISWQIYPEH
jgi:hypothetical protein